MSYFKQIDDCQTYNGQKYDFHYDYNGNSGGGQPFLGGQFALNGDGDPEKPLYLNGKIATFIVRFVDTDGVIHDVDLGTKDEYRLPITPRSNGSKQMKLKTEGKLVRPSLILPAVLMLPETTTVDMAVSLDASPLTTGNYWLQSMWLDCELTDDVVHLVPKDYVFCGGTSKRGEYADQAGKPTGNVMFFELDYRKRINDILYAANNCEALSQPVASILQYFRDVLLGNIAFDHKDCYSKTAELMSLTAREHPTIYSGIDDPLPTIMAAVAKSAFSSRSIMYAPSKVPEPCNLIFFGAPGTGKSFQLARLATKYFADENVRRQTFYPDYTYGQFVGCFKPFIEPEIDDESPSSAIEYAPGRIEYKFVPGPFIDTYVDAIRHPDENHLLIIEEINRANPAAVFGDVFQLLDRKEDGASEYSVATSEDLRWYLFKQWKSYLNGAKPQERSSILYSLDDPEAERLASSISLPPNMYIWASMNSADQGVFPMDTAFKRRWDFRYMGINEGEDATPAVLGGERLDKHTVKVNAVRIVWNELRKAINTLLLDNDVNEDKLLGPFFLSPGTLSDEPYGDQGKSRFIAAFEDKVLLYLYEDAGKMRRTDIFRDGNATFADICTEFERNGVDVFKQETKKNHGIFDKVFATVDKPDASDQDNEG